MTLAFSSPPANVPLGAGGLLFVTIPAGPIPNDDYVTAEAVDPATGAAWPFGDHITNGHLSNGIVLGRSETAFPLTYTGRMHPLDPYEITVYQLHASGVVVDSSPARTFYWDPYSGLFVLMQGLAHDPVLDDILAAVTRSFDTE